MVSRNTIRRVTYGGALGAVEGEPQSHNSYITVGMAGPMGPPLHSHLSQTGSPELFGILNPN